MCLMCLLYVPAFRVVSVSVSFVGCICALGLLHWCRCHKKGLDGKLGLAMQWAFEQEEAGGEVNFKEGLAFYSSIGILQVNGRFRLGNDGGVRAVVVVYA